MDSVKVKYDLKIFRVSRNNNWTKTNDDILFLLVAQRGPVARSDFFTVPTNLLLICTIIMDKLVNGYNFHEFFCNRNFKYIFCIFNQLPYYCIIAPTGP